MNLHPDDIQIVGLYEREFIDDHFYDVYDITKEEIKELYPEYPDTINFLTEDGYVLFYLTKEEIENYL